MTALLRTVLALALTACATAAQAQPDNRGWPRSELLAVVGDLSGTSDLDLQPVAEVGHQMLHDPAESAGCFAGPDDRLEGFVVGDFASVVFSGHADTIHTVWLVFPVLNVGDTDAALAFYAGVFGYMFPDWPGARTWARDSLSQSWEAVARAERDPMISVADTMPRHSVGDARLSTWGVPPDIVFYRVTARPECETISALTLASPRQAPRIESQRDLDRQSSSLRLYYSRPVATDLSATPYFLGDVSARFADGALRVSEDGTLPGAVLESSAWLDRQVADRGFATMLEAAEEGWGYEHTFLYLVQQPKLPLASAGGSYQIVVEEYFGEITGTLSEGLVLAPEHLHGLLFGTDRPPGDPQTIEAPQVGYGGDLLGLHMPEPHPAIDISGTPMHLGRILHHYGPNLLAADYAARVEGSILYVEHAASGAMAEIDLTAWMERQAGEPPAPPDALDIVPARVIAEPVLQFELGGKPHVLVVESAAFVVVDGVPGAVYSLAAELFAAR